MIYESGTKLVSIKDTTLVFTVIEDQGEGSIRVEYTDGRNGLIMWVAWDTVRKLTKLELALR